MTGLEVAKYLAGDTALNLAEEVCREAPGCY